MLGHIQIKGVFSKYLMAIVMALFCADLQAQEQPSDSINTESDSFVKVDLIVCSPLPSVFSTFGHAALRMQCPPHGLDLVFSLENDPESNAFITGVVGKANAKYVYIPYSDYYELACEEGRRMEECQVNLQLNERKELWRVLDEEVLRGAYRHFNLLRNNCMSMVLSKLDLSLSGAGEHIEWGDQEEIMKDCDGDYYRHAVSRSPWTEFVLTCVIGSDYGIHSPIEQRIIPVNALEVMKRASIVNDSTGATRPLLAGSPKATSVGTVDSAQNPFTPYIAFLILLAVTAVITIIQWKWKLNRLGTIFDYILFSLQALAGIVIIMMFFWSETFHPSWNWHIISFLPLPLCMLLCNNCKKSAKRGWLTASLLLALMAAATPLIGYFDTPHLFILLSLLTRTANRLFITKN